jgi:hypothetical protein
VRHPLEAFFVFDATYFRKGLAAHTEAAGAEATVEVHLVNGQAHRVRSVIEVSDGFVLLEVYQRRPEITSTRSQWLGNAPGAAGPNEIHRAAVTYESITQIVITPAESKGSSRIGFNAPM